MRKTCQICWKEFNAKKKSQVYCSVDCKIICQRLPDINCEVCGKLFHPSKSWVKTCSKECGYKSMSLWDRECEYCWKTFKPEHSYNKYCSRDCSVKWRTYLAEKPCLICWKMFKPRTSKTICCSMSCAQKYNRENKPEEKKRQTIEMLINSSPSTISKTNLLYEWLLNNAGFDVEKEFTLWRYSYDLRVWDILIEINPFAYHSSNRAPQKWKVKPKHPKYHYNKAKFAIDMWYRIIEFWDRMSDNELFDILYNLKQTVLWEIHIHWFNPKTKKHILDEWHNEEEMSEKWYVKIYDAWEQYIFNSTNI